MTYLGTDLQAKQLPASKFRCDFCSLSTCEFCLLHHSCERCFVTWWQDHTEAYLHKWECHLYILPLLPRARWGLFSLWANSLCRFEITLQLFITVRYIPSLECRSVPGTGIIPCLWRNELMSSLEKLYGSSLLADTRVLVSNDLLCTCHMVMCWCEIAVYSRRSSSSYENAGKM